MCPIRCQINHTQITSQNHIIHIIYYTIVYLISTNHSAECGGAHLRRTLTPDERRIVAPKKIEISFRLAWLEKFLKHKQQQRQQKRRRHIHAGTKRARLQIHARWQRESIVRFRCVCVSRARGISRTHNTDIFSRIGSHQRGRRTHARQLLSVAIMASYTVLI